MVIRGTANWRLTPSERVIEKSDSSWFFCTHPGSVEHQLKHLATEKNEQNWNLELVGGRGFNKEDSKEDNSQSGLTNNCNHEGEKAWVCYRDSLKQGVTPQLGVID